MKKNEIYEGIVTELKFPNKGIVRTEEGNVTVKGVLPGQKVSFKLTKKKHERMEGRLQEVLVPAENEIKPECPHFGICGGCTYQNLTSETQAEMKAGQVRKLLTNALQNFGDAAFYGSGVSMPVIDEDTVPGSVNVPNEILKKGDWFEGVIQSPKAEGYRNKMEYSFGNAVIDGPLELGMHRAGRFNDVVTVDQCRIVDEDYRKILSATHDFFKSREIPFWRKRTEEGYLRHFLVRKAHKTGEILILLETTSQMSPDLNEFKECLLSLDLEGEIVGLLHLTNDLTGDVVKGEDIEILHGRDYFYEELLGLRFKITPFSFFQTNSYGAEVLYEKAREYAMEGMKLMSGDDTRKPVIFDLYSGTGTIGQIMAPVAEKVIGIEIVGEAVEAAKENAELNGLKNTEFIAGDVLKMLDEVEEKPDFIMLDPPREGCTPKALNKILDYGVQSIVYISCKPTSLARDIDAIIKAGYRVVKASCVDMFPFTANVETVVLLSQQNPDDRIRVKVDLDELDETSAEAKATYKKITEWVQEKYGFHVTNLNIAQVKRKNGIIERDNYNKPKSDDSRQPGTIPEKERAITEALKYFKMI
ncbi:23S rRNA (uracil-5-)-methyltransferase RumA [Lachnospiraceae bacterium]|nr:23S rRNA (uracil-5-)-methyltransferase RumA [Lachnospiraceae bacterium]